MTRPDPTDGLLGALRQWAADQQTSELARSRSQQRWLRQQAAESTTLAGTLLDLAERRAIVTIESGGWVHTGRLIAVTTGLCLLDDLDDEMYPLALLRLAPITIVRSPVDALGDREPDLELELPDALAALAGDRPRVSLESQEGKKVDGVLEYVGIDLVGVRVDGPARGVVHLALNSISACLF